MENFCFPKSTCTCQLVTLFKIQVIIDWSWFSFYAPYFRTLKWKFNFSDILEIQLVMSLIFIISNQLNLVLSFSKNAFSMYLQGISFYWKNVIFKSNLHLCSTSYILSKRKFNWMACGSCNRFALFSLPCISFLCKLYLIMFLIEKSLLPYCVVAHVGPIYWLCWWHSGLHGCKRL